jgi:FkbM family methyltransferase
LYLVSCSVKYVPIKSFVKELLLGSRFYMPARNLYWTLTDSNALKLHQQLRSFYRQFLSPRDLAFDIGANIGEHSEALLACGARVVAVEPMPRCASFLTAIGRRKPMEIVIAAAGDSPGETTLFVGKDIQHSTVSPDWVLLASSVHAEPRWTGQIRVPIVTLNDLAERYGIPSLVKIDVEGFERSVLRGMSFRPTVVTFEYQASALDWAEECADILSDSYRYAVESGPYVERRLLRRQLELAAKVRRSGDVVAIKNHV